MKKIVVLRCLKAEENCTGASCLKAFNNKSAYFSRYADQEIELWLPLCHVMAVRI